MSLEIVRAADPSLDAWRGMADFTKTNEFNHTGVTKADMRSGAGRGSRDGGAGTGIRALWADSLGNNAYLYISDSGNVHCVNVLRAPWIAKGT